jgi:hypothetical protein
MKKNHRLYAAFISAIIAVVFGTARIDAATYYLDAVNGSDSSSGSSTTPWKTLAKAQATVVAGDTVLMRTGSYGPFSQTKKYTNYVTYKADTGAVPQIDSLYLGRTASAYMQFDGLTVNADCFIYGADHVNLLNCTIHALGDRYASAAQLINMIYSTNCTINHCSISHCNTAITGDNSTNPTITNNNVFDVDDDVFCLTPSYNLLIQNNHVHNVHQDRFRLKDEFSSWPFIPAASQVSVSDSISSPDLKVTVQGGYTGVLCYVNLGSQAPSLCNTTTFANINNFSITLSSTVGLSSGDLVMRISSAANGATSAAYVDVAIPAAGGSFDPSAAETITSVKSVALVLKTSKSAATFTIDDWGGSNGAHQDFAVIGGTNAVIRNNIVHDAINQGVFSSPTGNITGITMENNLFYDIEGYSFTNLGITGTGIIRNNTFIGYRRPIYYPNKFSAYYLNGNCNISANDSGSGLRIGNNICAANLASGGAYNDYNITQSQSGAIGPHSLAISGTNPAGFCFDTGFFDAINTIRYNGQQLQYLLIAGSPAINAGNAADQPADSVGTIGPDGFLVANGTPRDASHHSVGAREYPQSLPTGGTTPPPTNTPPVFNPISSQSVAAGSALNFTVTATDADNNPLTYSATGLPTGATFAGNTFAWIPSSTQVGQYAVTFSVSDGTNSVSENVTITVTADPPPTNTPPVFNPTSSQSVKTGSALSFTVSATDAENNPLKYTATGLPTGATFTGNTFSWTPSSSQAGTYTVTFSVSDGTNTVSENVTITVTAAVVYNPADMNKDGVVNALDYALFSAAWYNWTLAADLNGNGIVDNNDLAIFVTNWLAANPDSNAPTSQLPIGYWKFDATSGTTAVDSSATGNTGTLLGSPTWVAGKFSGALQFNGTTQAVRIPTTAMKAKCGTVSMWVRPSGFNAAGYLLGHCLVDWSNRIQLYLNSSGALGLGLGNNHSLNTGITTLAVNTWYNVVLTWDGANYVVYVNGASKASGTYSGLVGLASTIDIGNDDTYVHNEGFNGTIDEVQVYNRAVTAAEATGLYNGVVAGTVIPTIGYWNFNETSGTTAADSSGKGNTATLIDNPTWTTGGHLGGALTFYGTTQAARISTSVLSLQKGSASLWVKPAGFSSTPNYLFGFSQPDWSNRLQVYTSGTGGGLSLGMGNTHALATNIKTLAVGSWYHVVLTWDGTNYVVYVNGAAAKSGTYSGLTTLSTVADIGNDGTTLHNESFNGVIDEVKLFDHALSTTEVTTLYCQ